LLPGDGYFFLGRKLDAQGLADAAGNFVLNLEDILELAIIAFRPDKYRTATDLSEAGA
jgi:hypothetical protein